jgi:gas vesicle protein
MADNFDQYERESRGNGAFVMGLLTGAALGAGIGMLLAPKAGSELRGAIGEQAKNWGNVASEQYKKAADTAGTWADQGRDMVNKAREAVARNADDARDIVASSADQARDAVARGADQARDAVARSADKARDAVVRGADQARDYASGPKGGNGRPMTSSGGDFDRS